MKKKILGVGVVLILILMLVLLIINVFTVTGEVWFKIGKLVVYKEAI